MPTITATTVKVYDHIFPMAMRPKIDSDPSKFDNFINTTCDPLFDHLHDCEEGVDEKDPSAHNKLRTTAEEKRQLRNVNFWMATGYSQSQSGKEEQLSGGGADHP